MESFVIYNDFRWIFLYKRAQWMEVKLLSLCKLNYTFVFLILTENLKFCIWVLMLDWFIMRIFCRVRRRWDYVKKEAAKMLTSVHLWIQTTSRHLRTRIKTLDEDVYFWQSFFLVYRLKDKWTSRKDSDTPLQMLVSYLAQRWSWSLFTSLFFLPISIAVGFTIQSGVM